MSDMCKHPLLPDTYLDRSIQSAILSALKPYKLNDGKDISNPRLKWDLVRAWQNAEALLMQGTWKYKRIEFTATEIGYELTADSEQEIEDLHAVLAGIVAYQMLEPESGVAVHRVEYKKGGQMVVAISGHAASKLKELIPAFMGTQDVKKEPKHWWSFLVPQKNAK